MSQYTVIALYKFVALPDFEEIQKPLLNKCLDFGVCGTLLLAHEGINGTIAGQDDRMKALIAYIQEETPIGELVYKASYVDFAPFNRMKVRLKKEIVTLGVPWVDPTKNVGTYLKPKEWNEVISQPDVFVVDTRNDYEVELGTFEHAVDPKTKTFREFPEYVEQNMDPKKHKRVAMFCTGGIRCEKSTAYMLGKGFEEVYHLEGGILKYLEEMPKEESLWKGECFVFDHRVSVDHDLEKGKYELCFACQHPLDEEDLKSPDYEEGIVCPHCKATVSPENRARFAARQKQMELEREREKVEASA